MKRRRKTTREGSRYLSYAFPKSPIIQLGIAVVIIGAIILAFVAGLRMR